MAKLTNTFFDIGQHRGLGTVQSLQVTGHNGSFTTIEDLSSLGTVNTITSATTTTVSSGSTADDGLGTQSSEDIVVVDYQEFAAVQATGTIQIGDYTGISGDTITINGTVFTEGVDFTAETSDDATASNLKDAIDAAIAAEDVNLDGIITAEVSTDTVTITAVTAGSDGNSITLATSDAVNVTLSDSTLTGGDDAEIITVNGITITEGVDFTAATSEDNTGDLIAAVINGNSDFGVTAVNASGTITLTAIDYGTAGDSIGLETSNTDALTVGAANLSGGANPGTGARTVRISGLDGSGLPVTEDAVLEGRNGVTLSNQYLAVNSIEVLTAGSGGANAGIIYVGSGTITTGVPAVIIEGISIGHNVNNNAKYTVPLGSRFIINSLNVHASDLDGTTKTDLQVTVDVRIRDVVNNGLSQLIHKVVIAGGDSSVYSVSDSPFSLPEGYEMKLRVTGTSAGTASATISGLLITE